jgi:hypothetical protein
VSCALGLGLCLLFCFVLLLCLLLGALLELDALGLRVGLYGLRFKV